MKRGVIEMVQTVSRNDMTRTGMLQCVGKDVSMVLDVQVYGFKQGFRPARAGPGLVEHEHVAMEQV